MVEMSNSIWPVFFSAGQAADVVVICLVALVTSYMHSMFLGSIRHLASQLKASRFATASIQAMAPKQDQQAERRPDLHIGPFVLFGECELFPKTPRQPTEEDRQKMEQLAADVAEHFAHLWGPDGIPPNGFPRFSSMNATHRHALRQTLWSIPNEKWDTETKLVIWDLLQNKYTNL
jgi:hypothetical protein